METYQGGIVVSNVIEMHHPLIKHKITMLRDETTGTNEFRKLVEEIAMLMGYEALADLKTKNIAIKTPIEATVQPILDGRKPAVLPILRAGLGMLGGMLALLPNAKVGHIGMSRDERTHQPKTYYCKLPPYIEDRLIIVVDPMLATGGSLIDAVSEIKARGGKTIKCMCIIAAPEGVEAFTKAHPDVLLYVGAIDRCLNADAYICPGLGDAGDRIFGTPERDLI